jgi:hypothetical protein
MSDVEQGGHGAPEAGYGQGYDGGYDGGYEQGPASEAIAGPDMGWTGALPDPDARAFAEMKGWRGPADMLTSYRALEKMLGSEKLPLPRDEQDRDGYERVYKALGRPDSPDGYGIVQDGSADPAFASEAARWFHEAGLSTKQGQALAERFNEHVARAEQMQAQAQATRSIREIDDMRSVWGDRFDANVEMGRRAANRFGLTSGEINAMEHAVGTKRMLALMQKIGQGFGEHSFVAGDDRAGGFRMTPQAARARISALKGDTAWARRYLNGDADARAEMTRLQEASAGE